MSRVAAVEVFRSVQGEGYNSGREAIFVRLAGCNLSCVFAEGAVCDTPYMQANIKVDSVAELFEKNIWPLTLATSGVKAPESPGDWYKNDEGALMLILTGGEPTMAPAFDELVHEGCRRGFYVAVETNGTKWREGLRECHWISCSPKESVRQGSTALHHNHNPQSPQLHTLVKEQLAMRASRPAGEYRFVVSAAGEAAPPFLPAFRHYVSPAVLADGVGLEWKTAFPGFVSGAVERCLEIVQTDPRWRVSLQTHKLLKVR